MKKLFILLVAACFIFGGYAQKSAEKLEKNQKDSEINNSEKFIILQSGDQTWYFDNLQLDGDILTGTLNDNLDDHLKYSSPEQPEGTKQIEKQNHPDIINEVHIYTEDAIPVNSTSASIPITSIEKIELYNTNKKTTTRSWIRGSQLTEGAAMIAAVIISTMRKGMTVHEKRYPRNDPGSCPYVYVFDGKEYNFIGEVYAGATLPSLERNDYMPLPGIKSENGQYRIIMANELMEKQYINLAELMVVNHPENVQVLPDKSGKIHSVKNLQVPLSAYSGNIDYLEQIKEKDNCFYIFNGDNESNDLSSLILTFKKPDTWQTEKDAKLIINASTTMWMDYIYEQYSSLFGRHYDDFIEKQNRAPHDKTNKWILEQGLPLSVYHQTEDGWEFIDYYNITAGQRDMLLPIEISQGEKEKIKIKLECGFNFWELDYAAIDFSDDIQFEVNYIQSAEAIDEKGNDISDQISKDDEIYLCQLNIGEEASLTYDAISVPEKMKQTVILHTKGYYTKIRNYNEKRKLFALIKFKKPGRFSTFSKEHYEEIYQEYTGESTHQ